MKRRALVTGATGQDGSYLVDRLIASGHEVWGTSQTSNESSEAGIRLITVDLANADDCRGAIRETSPDVVFHFGAISSVGYSWDHPAETVTVNSVSTTSLLDSLLAEQDSTGRERRFVNASSGEIFAGTENMLQDETTTICPVSPYGASKALAHQMVQVYRGRGLHASNAIFFNHESPRRPKNFVTRKITSAVAAISLGRQEMLELGNMAAKRDWGWAPDYVDCAIRISNQQKAADYVVATGQSHSVQEFVQEAFEAVGISNWRDYVRTSAEFTRPSDPGELVGDSTRAKLELDWRPTKTFSELVKIMVAHDVSLLKSGS